MKRFVTGGVMMLLFFIMISCNSYQKEQESKSKANLPVALSAASGKASCVFLTADEKNNPAISWVEIDSSGKKHFYFARWKPSVHAFSSPHAIPIEQNAAMHEEGMPKIAFKGDGSLFAMYETSVPVQ